jgi:hypothetical protein
MLIQGQQGLPQKLAGGATNPTVAMGFLAELLKSSLMPDYYTLVKTGFVYFLPAAAANVSTFVGGAGGTPLLAIFNPPNSGKDLIILQSRIAVRTTGTAAVGLDFNWWIGPSASPTGTRTNPFNSYSLAQAGAQALGFVNTALTGSTALGGGPFPVLSIGNIAVAGVQVVGQFYDETRGLVLVAPGNLAALGASAGTTAASFDAAITWAETPSA